MMRAKQNGHAPVAQLAARRSHNPKVASSILAGSIVFCFFFKGTSTFWVVASWMPCGCHGFRLDGRAVQGASLRH